VDVKLITAWRHRRRNSQISWSQLPGLSMGMRFL